MRYARCSIAMILAMVLLTQAACGANFAGQLRTILAVAPALVDSLVAAGVIKPALRDTFIKDFGDITAGAATLKESLDACADKPCKLDAVNVFQQTFFTVQARGNLGSVTRTAQIQGIIAAIITAARAYYSPPSRTARAASNPEAELKARLAELKAAMSVK